MNRKSFLIEHSCLKVIAVLLMLIPVLANALVITLEPDDYGMGVPLENEYVTVASTDGYSYPWSSLSATTARGASLWDKDYKAPTGDLTFGNYSLTPPLLGSDRGWGGLLLRFNQAVSRVTMLANSGRSDQLFSGAGWVAFDFSGNQIGFGAAGPDGASGDVFEIDITLEDIWVVIMGGAETIPYIYFDHLTFEVPEISVPAPNPFILLMISLLLCISCRQLRKGN